MPDPAGGIKCLVEVMVLIKRFQNKSKYSHSNQIHKKSILAKRVTFGYKMLIPLKKFILWLNRGRLFDEQLVLSKTIEINQSLNIVYQYMIKYSNIASVVTDYVLNYLNTRFILCSTFYCYYRPHSV